MKITRKEIDLAKKWRVQVALDDGNSIFLKFNKEPTDKEVFARLAIELETIKKSEKVISEELEKSLLVRDISLEELKEKLDGDTK